MQHLLDDIWDGKKEMPVIEIRKSEEYRTLAKQHIQAVGTLRKMLGEELRVYLDEAITSHDILSSYCEKEAFKRGVRFGIQLMNEANDHQT